MLPDWLVTCNGGRSVYHVASDITDSSICGMAKNGSYKWSHSTIETVAIAARLAPKKVHICKSCQKILHTFSIN